MSEDKIDVKKENWFMEWAWDMVYSFFSLIDSIIDFCTLTFWCPNLEEKVYKWKMGIKE